MSDAERRMADYIAEQSAQITVARVMDILKDDHFIEEVIGKWGGAFDKTLGKGIRRLFFYVALAAVAALGAKFGLLDKFFAMFKP